MDTVFSIPIGQLDPCSGTWNLQFLSQEPPRDDNSGINRAIKRGMLPFDDLVCLDPKMSEARRSHRLATDFSIARILAADEPCSSSAGSSGSSHAFFEGNRIPKSNISNCPCCPNVLIATQAINSFDSIPEDQKGLIATSNRTERQDNRCLVTTDSALQTTAKNPTEPIPQDDCIGQGNDLPWLHCTRYRPPRLPKRSSAGKISKRRPGKHPRIPFTAFQLQILEDKYSKGAYLARRDVVQLSLILRLPQSRVKIWFQNRRARERRESIQSVNEGAKSDKVSDK